MRYPPIPKDQMTDEQRRVFDAIAGRSARGVAGPFVQLMHTPEINNHIERLTLEMRYGTVIPEPLRVLAVMVVARHWNCQVEFHVHLALAREAGLSENIVKSVAAGRRPAELSADQALIYDFCTKVCKSGRVADATFDGMAARFGSRLVLELTALCGNFTMLALILNVSQTPMPAGFDPPLDPPIL